MTKSLCECGCGNDIAAEIRRLAASGSKHADIAAVYAVCRPLVTMIVGGRRWK